MKLSDDQSMKYLNLELEKLEFPRFKISPAGSKFNSGLQSSLTFVDCGVIDLVVDLNGESGGSLSIFRRIQTRAPWNRVPDSTQPESDPKF